MWYCVLYHDSRQYRSTRYTDTNILAPTTGSGKYLFFSVEISNDSFSVFTLVYSGVHCTVQVLQVYSSIELSPIMTSRLILIGASASCVHQFSIPSLHDLVTAVAMVMSDEWWSTKVISRSHPESSTWADHHQRVVVDTEYACLACLPIRRRQLTWKWLVNYLKTMILTKSESCPSIGINSQWVTYMYMHVHSSVLYCAVRRMRHDCVCVCVCVCVLDLCFRIACREMPFWPKFSPSTVMHYCTRVNEIDCCPTDNGCACVNLRLMGYEMSWLRNVKRNVLNGWWHLCEWKTCLVVFCVCVKLVPVVCMECWYWPMGMLMY